MLTTMLCSIQAQCDLSTHFPGDHCDCVDNYGARYKGDVLTVRLTTGLGDDMTRILFCDDDF